MKKILTILSLFVLLCTLLTTGIMATETGATSTETTGTVENATEQGTGSAMDEMPPMEFEINGGAFVDSLSYMGQGMLGIFVVTLVIIGVVAILNWHGRHLEKKYNKEDN